MTHKTRNRESIKQVKLVLALLIDFVGLLSYFVPITGELFDAIWAPTAAFLVYFLFHRKLSWASFIFIEELLPFGDAIPSATMAWYFMYHKKRDVTH